MLHQQNKNPILKFHPDPPQIPHLLATMLTQFFYWILISRENKKKMTGKTFACKTEQK